MKILLAIDGSECSKEAIRTVAMLPPSEATEVRVFTAFEPVYSAAYLADVMVVPVSPATVEGYRHEAEGMAAAVAGMIRDRGFKADWVVQEGTAGRAIVEAAKSWGAELIVVGSHGRTGVKRFLMGSVAQWVMDHAPCSVEIARPLAHGGEAAAPELR